jgi:hypothetical protein
MPTPPVVELSVSSIFPKHPERICWGCEKLCPANHLMCRETRVAHPVELYGDDWWQDSNADSKSDMIQISPLAAGERS